MSEEEFSQSEEETETEHDAIQRLDFERAEEIHSARRDEEDYETMRVRDAFLEKSEYLAQQDLQNYNDSIEEIKEQFVEASEMVVKIWEERCRMMVQRQRKEAENLENAWRKRREQEIKRLCGIVRDGYGTAKIMAMCNEYKRAKEIKDSLDEFIKNAEHSDAVKKLDAEFAERYRQMIARHEKDFVYLHQSLTGRLAIWRKETEAAQIEARNQLTIQEASRPSVIIDEVSQVDVSPKARNVVVRDFSPRRQLPAGSSKSYSRMSSPRSSRMSFSRGSRISSPTS